MIVGNKIDKKDEREVSFKEGLAFCRLNDIPFFETSALKNNNIENVFDFMGRFYLE